MYDDRLIADLVGLLQQMDNQAWASATLLIQAPPLAKRGYILLPGFRDTAGNKISIFPKLDSAVEQTLFAFIFFRNKTGRMNEITFKVNREDYSSASLHAGFNEQVDKDFYSSLPLAKRKKAIAWYTLPVS